MQQFTRRICSILLIFWCCTHIANAQDTAVTEKDNNGTVRLGLNRTLTVRLAQTGGTGYRWAFGKTADSRILALASTINTDKGDEQFAKENTQVFRYTGRSAGTTMLTLALTRTTGDEVDEADTFRLTVEVGSDSGGKGSGVTLQDGSNGKNVKFRVGDTINVRLTVTAGTGYRWTPEKVPMAFFRAVGQPQIEKPIAKRIGANSTQVFRYRVLRSGNGQLRFAYRRGFQKGGKALRTWQVNFTTPQP